MAEFLKGSTLNSRLERIFEDAKSHLVIISPYIKLHSRLVDTLKSKKSEADLEISVVFGKNQADISKSLSIEDFLFLKEFPNIEIRYEPRLHAKYYANETHALLSSMNLYDYSQNHNIEFGIMTRAVGFLGRGDRFDSDAFNYFDQVVRNSSLLYRAVPKFENKLMGLHRKYLSSVVEVDKLSREFNIRPTYIRNINETTTARNIPSGYCIRTGVSIPYDLDKPLCDEAYRSWSKYKNMEYKENYCHFSGEPSHGETSFGRPILRRNWEKAQKLMGK
jgi:hypothetical protein